MSQWSTSTPSSGSWSTTSWTPISSAAANTPCTTAWRSPNTKAYGVAQRKRYAKPLPFAPLTKQRPATRTRREGEQALQHGGGRVVGGAADEQDAEDLGEHADRQQRAGRAPGRWSWNASQTSAIAGAHDVEPPERAGHAAPVGRGAHGGFGDRQRNRFPRRLLRHPAGFLERRRTIRDVCPGGQTAKSAALKAVRSKGHCGFDSRPGYSRPGPCAGRRPPRRSAPQMPGGVATEVRSGRATGPPDGPSRGRTNVLL